MSLENTLNLIEEVSNGRYYANKAVSAVKSRASKANRYVQRQLGNIKGKANQITDSLYRKTGSVSPREAAEKRATLKQQAIDAIAQDRKALDPHNIAPITKQQLDQGYNALSNSSMMKHINHNKKQEELTDTFRQQDIINRINSKATRAANIEKSKAGPAQSGFHVDPKPIRVSGSRFMNNK